MASVIDFDSVQERERLVEQIERQGIRDPRVLDAMRSVPREAFLPPELKEFAYRDSALPIGNEQTISQPFIVALMAAALDLQPEDRVLEIGTGSGYAAAVLAKIAEEIYTVERYRTLAEQARGRLEEEGFHNVHVLHGDGTRGWPEHAPFDAITVAAGGPKIPPPLLEQLRVGGRLVIPIGGHGLVQKLVRIRKTGEDEYERDELADVRFVPLVGLPHWDGDDREWDGAPTRAVSSPETIAGLVREEARPLEDIESADLNPLLECIGGCRLVLIGEATHGTSEFYSMRARITRELIERRGFDFVAVEADWPDAARINAYVQRQEAEAPPRWQAFARFPTWMWRNQETLQFVDWLREYNRSRRQSGEGAAFCGLDLYSLSTSIHAVLDYLDGVDPEAARVARERYGCLSPWEGDPETYGKAAVSGGYEDCEDEAIAMLEDLLARRLEYAARDGQRFFDAAQNAKLVADAERYYRAMYYGGVESWNLRDEHMFDTLRSLLGHHGAGAKGVVWAHNSHLGNAAATEMVNMPGGRRRSATALPSTRFWPN